MVYLESFTRLVIIGPKTLIILKYSLFSTLIWPMPKSRKWFVEIHIEQIVNFKKKYSDRLREIESIILSCVKWLAGDQMPALKNDNE